MICLNLFVNGYTIPLNVLSYCAGYRIRVNLFMFNAVSSLLKYMQFALQCNRSDLRAIQKRHQQFCRRSGPYREFLELHNLLAIDRTQSYLDMGQSQRNQISLFFVLLLL